MSTDDKWTREGVMNYYQKIWTESNNHGTLFWENVDFSKKEYKYQETVFRDYIRRLRNDGIKSVLELGAGSGRVSNIILQELPSIEKYDIIDIRPQLPEEILNDKRVKVYSMDLTEHSGVNLVIDGDKIYHEKYDLVLAIEVFMHIKPHLSMGGQIRKEIDSVIKKYTNFLAPEGKIINIDWQFEPNALSEWCFIHDYDKLYRENGLHPIFTADMKEIKQKLFCYGK